MKPSHSSQTLRKYLHSQPLVINANRRLAENALVKDRENAAASALSDCSTDGAEASGRDRDVRRRSTIQVSNTENIGCTALGAIIEPRAGVVSGTAAAITAVATAASAGGNGKRDTGEEGNEDSGSLHGDEFAMNLMVLIG